MDANPISTVVITWRRRRNSTSSDILDPPTPTLLTGIGGNGIVETTSSSSPYLLLVDQEGKNNSNLNFRTKQTMERNRSLLIIHNVSRDDSGSYDCLAFNGIGYEDSATANLVVKREFFLPSLFLIIIFSSLVSFFLLVYLSSNPSRKFFPCYSSPVSFSLLSVMSLFLHQRSIPSLSSLHLTLSLSLSLILSFLIPFYSSLTLKVSTE